MSKPVRTVAGLVAGASLMFATPGAASAMPPAPDDRPTVAELKLRNAWVPESAELRFGSEPLAHVQDSAAAAADAASCSITADEATALSIAMTWPEVAPSGAPPSPMTLSRYDIQPTLGDPQDRAEGLWFHPGIGMWQLDSAGLGTDFTAGEAMNTEYAASRMAPFLVGKYCDRIDAGASPADARAYAWTDWVACREGACEDIYQRALQGVTPVDGVGNYGGAEVRQCEVDGTTYECVLVDPANAQGSDWWADPANGRSPVAAPFYVFRQDGSTGSTEVRYWLAADSGAGEDVRADRPFGGNARDSLTWSTGSGLCDLTTGRGDC